MSQPPIGECASSSSNPRIAPVPEPPEPLKPNLINEWMLDPEIAFLHHGCFGARPRIVAEEQQRWRDCIDASPIHWLDRRRGELLSEAKTAVGRFIGATPDNFGFVTNATEGVNAFLRSLDFQPGDELLTINHVYNAIRMAMRHVAARSGAMMIELEVPFPIDSPQTVIDIVEQHLSPRTKLLIIDHITSPTALLLPVRAIMTMCEARGIDVLIDGAHAPGMVELDIESLGGVDHCPPAYYAGNLHKWACAPMGAAFLWVRPDKQKLVHPTTISHFLGQGLAAEFGWQGTRDISAWLSAPKAIEYMQQFGWDRVREHNHQMAVWAMHMLCEAWGVSPTSPPDGSMLGSMVTLRLPDAVRTRFESAEQMQIALYEQHKVEAPIIDWNGSWWTRASCQVYNTRKHIKRLASAVQKWC